MTDTVYVDNTTLFMADSANDFNRLHYTIFSDPADLAAVKTTLHAAPGAIGGTTPAAGSFSALTLSGNINLGANYISRAGTSAGFSLDAFNNVTLSNQLNVGGTLTGAGAASFTIITASGGLATVIGTAGPAVALNPSSGATKVTQLQQHANIFEVSDSGSTNRLTVDLATGNTVVGGTLTSNSGAAIGGATAGTGGLAFPATQSAQSDANTLDDYEEGTWTPSLGGSATYTTQEAYYIKIGKLVYIQAKLQVNALGTGSTTTISGLPFTVQNTGSYGSGVVGYFASLAVSPVVLTCNAVNNTTTLNFNDLTAASATMNSAVALFGNNARVDLSLMYEATA